MNNTPPIEPIAIDSETAEAMNPRDHADHAPVVLTMCILQRDELEKRFPNEDHSDVDERGALMIASGINPDLTGLQRVLVGRTLQQIGQRIEQEGTLRAMAEVLFADIDQARGADEDTRLVADEGPVTDGE